MNTTADAVVEQRAGDRERMSRERFDVSSRRLLLQARHVGDQRVEVRGRQTAVLGRHRRLLGGLGLRRHLRRVRDPLPDIVGAQLLADAVQRVRLVALAGDGVADLALLSGVDLLALS